MKPAEHRQIAVIGMAGRFPRSRGLAEFWTNLRAGRECVSFFSEEELIASGVPAEIRKHAGFVPAGGVLQEIDLFDAAFFGFQPREAEIADPQQRFFLECAWEAIENAGYDPQRFDGRIGVFASSGMDTYLRINLAAQSGLVAAVGFDQLRIGNRLDNLATRTAYKLDLTGPSMTVQTGCSSSLVAVHLASQSLLAGECDLVLAGGVRISVGRERGYIHTEGGVLSPDGHCRAFDAEGRGTVAGDGVGVVVLKRLNDALRDGDAIDAVILGSAVNNDGAEKIGYTAPSVRGQASVITEALAVAGVPARSVTHVEAHGTGTLLGDPIEITALTEAFRYSTNDCGFCAVSSVKSNIGHLDAAAGIAGFIKCVLELKNRELVPSVHFQSPNPRIAFEQSPFYVNRELKRWTVEQGTRRAGVSSFGIGGTNVHAILEEAPRQPVSESSRKYVLLTVSAPSVAALEASDSALRQHLAVSPESCADAAFTTQVGRRPFRYRRAVVLDAATAVPAAVTLEAGEPVSGAVAIAFLFPGQGTQFPGMFGELYEREPVYRETVDACCERYRAVFGDDLLARLYSDGADLVQTQWAQPALFATEYALAKLWMSWGIRPAAMMGHSIGEFVCACLAGVFSLDDAVELVGRRGRLMQSLPPGMMISIGMAEHEAMRMLPPGLSVAAINGPRLCTVAGPAEQVGALARRLEADGVMVRELRVSHAFHSPAMDPIAETFAAQARSLQGSGLSIPFLSNRTGDWITRRQLASEGYWGRQLREPVRFSQGLHELLRERRFVLLEVGPGTSLSTLVRSHPDCSPTHVVIASGGRAGSGQSDTALLLAALGRLWTAGAEVDWPAVHVGETRRRVHLPGYQFQRERFWIDPPEAAPAINAGGGSPAVETDPGAWFRSPCWRQSELADAAPSEPAGRVWLLHAGSALGRALECRLKRHGTDCRSMSPRGFRELRDGDGRPARIIFAGNYGEQAYYDLLNLAQWIGDEAADVSLSLTVVTQGLFDVLGGETVNPEWAFAMGPSLVIPQEYPNVSCRLVDCGLDADEQLLDRLLAESFRAAHDPVVAFRRNRRWTLEYRRLAAGPVDSTAVVRPGGHYLITGGLGGIGLELARELASAGAGFVTLISRSATPRAVARDELRRITKLGAVARPVRADCADRGEMAVAVREARQIAGDIHGVIHAAGVPGGAAMQLKQPRDAESVMRPKVEGVRVLRDLVAGTKLDFFVMCSSLTAIRGGFGQSDYASANAYLDAVSRVGIGGCSRTISINWSAWRDVGMAAEAVLPADLAWRRGERLKYGIPPAEGSVAFMRALAYGMSQVQICPYDFRREATIRGSVPNRSSNGSPFHKRLQLQTEYTPASSVVEERIVEVWEEVFGIRPIGIHDNFYELGGHSLLATILAARLREIFSVRFGLAKVLEAGTIARLSEMLEEALVVEVEGMSEDQAHRSLARGEG
jgi:acyl transferase domain-containing protein